MIWPLDNDNCSCPVLMTIIPFLSLWQPLYPFPITTILTLFLWQPFHSAILSLPYDSYYVPSILQPFWTFLCDSCCCFSCQMFWPFPCDSCCCFSYQLFWPFPMMVILSLPYNSSYDSWSWWPSGLRRVLAGVILGQDMYWGGGFVSNWGYGWSAYPCKAIN